MWLLCKRISAALGWKLQRRKLLNDSSVLWLITASDILPHLHIFFSFRSVPLADTSIGLAHAYGESLWGFVREDFVENWFQITKLYFYKPKNIFWSGKQWNNFKSLKISRKLLKSKKKNLPTFHFLQGFEPRRVRLKLRSFQNSFQVLFVHFAYPQKTHINWKASTRVRILPITSTRRCCGSVNKTIAYAGKVLLGVSMHKKQIKSDSSRRNHEMRA